MPATIQYKQQGLKSSSGLGLKSGEVIRLSGYQVEGPVCSGAVESLSNVHTLLKGHWSVSQWEKTNVCSDRENVHLFNVLRWHVYGIIISVIMPCVQILFHCSCYHCWAMLANKQRQILYWTSSSPTDCHTLKKIKINLPPLIKCSGSGEQQHCNNQCMIWPTRLTLYTECQAGRRADHFYSLWYETARHGNK